MLSLVVALALQVAAGPDATLTTGQVQPWSKFEAADRLLDAEQARGIVDGEFRRAGMFGNYSGQWWRQAEVVGEMLCRRETYSVTLRPVAASTPSTPLRADRQTFTQFRSTYPEAATAQTCTETTGWINTMPDTRDAQVVGLARLIQAIAAASGDQALPFEIACESTSVRPCGDPRVALRTLSLPTLYSVQPVTEQYRSEPVVNGVRMRYAVRPADGVYNVYEASFGPSQTRDSWFVKLEGRDRLERVTIRRATVIYH